MEQIKSREVPRYWLGPLLLSLSLSASPVQGQILPDDSLGPESSIIITNTVINGELAEQIDGGAIRNTHLFHSFLEFNVGSGQRVYFTNPAGIETILSRVTGNSPSEILGTLGVAGSADLFLLNPNGIVFGPEARLDLRGSFTASTAAAISFADGSEFSAAQPQSSLLSISVPLGVQYGTQAQGDILHQGALAVASGESLTLFGNTTTSTGTLTAPGGTVRLLGNTVNLLEAASIDVSSDTGSGVALVGGDYRGRPTMPTAQRTVIGPNATIQADASASGSGGQIIVWAEEAAEIAGTLRARGGAIAGDGGLIETSSRETLRLNFTAVPDASALNGAAGLWLIDPTNITIVDSASPSPLPLSSGDPQTNTGNTVLAQDIVNALENGSNVTLTTDLGGSEAGNITLDTALSIFLFPFFSGSRELRLEASNDIILNQPIEVSSFGPAINIFLNAANDIVLNSSGSIKTASTDQIAGDVELRAGNNILFNSGSNIDTSATSGTAGSVELQASNTIDFQSGSSIDTSASGGTAGTISLQAGTLTLSNANLVSEAEDSVGGNITLQLDRLLLLRQGSRISTLATGTSPNSSDGNISITAPIVVAVPLENSDIIARASQGGNVTIDASGGIYGFTIQDTADPLSDPENNITATGQIVIEIPDVDPNRGLVELPTTLSDATDQIAQGCGTGSRVAEQQSEFIISGRGGLPLQPEEAIAADAVSVPWVSATPNGFELSSEPLDSFETALLGSMHNEPLQFAISAARGCAAKDNVEHGATE